LTCRRACPTRRDGELSVSDRVGDAEHKDTFAFRVFPSPQPARHTVTAIDPRGMTTAMLRATGCDVRDAPTTPGR
jgi:beta-galactosidase